MWVKGRGKTPARPSAKAVRVETFEHALALAMVELTTARKTSTQNSPNEARATPSHEASPDTPKPANLSGPKYTDMA